jgi:N-formylglutamate deformylase
MGESIWRHDAGDGPIVAVATHDGHEVRAEVGALLALSPAERRREEDPHTGEWTTIAPTRVVALRSRFEIDLNRPRDEAFYRTPADAWGLKVWKEPPSDGLMRRSLEEHDAFYSFLRERLREVERRYGKFVVLDLHSYNHRREGPDGPAADPEKNPQVNVGTGTMERSRWDALVDRFISDLSSFDFPGGPLDVRENVKFVGRAIPRFVHETFPETGCALAIEFKKFFMDEWGGELDRELHAQIHSALRHTIPGLLETLGAR